MKLRISLALITSFLIFSGTAELNAATIAGTSCTKVGATKTSGGFKYFCVKSGKKLVWNKGAAVKVIPTPSSSKSEVATPSASASSAVSAQTVLSTDEVAKHVTATSCWSIVFGNVYDLTKWIPKHPGGATVIRALCGKDGSDAFEAQHSNQGKPAKEIANYYLGKLGDSIKL